MLKWYQESFEDMTGDYIISPAVIDDMPTLLRLYKDMYDGHSRDGLHMPFTLDMSALSQVLPVLISSKLCCLYTARSKVEGEPVCGFISASVVRPERKFAMDGKMGLISDIYVSEAHRGHKVAGELLESAEKWLRARGVRFIECNVLTGNSAGLGFWHSKGYDSMAEICYKYI